MTRALRIEGRGPVALALRLFLARQGFAGTSIAHDAFAREIPPAVAARALALSLGSVHLLSRIIELPESAPIDTVQVSIAHRAGRTRIRAADLAAPALGHVVRYAALHRVLLEALRKIEAQSPSSAFALPPPSLAGDAGEILVRADGAPRSPSARILDFRQSALLAEVLTERDTPGAAFEHFTPEGPLALLPLPQAHRRSLVWCATPQQSARRAQLSSREFEDELLATFGNTLGTIRLASQRHQAPLQRKLAQRNTEPRCIAIGNAAQTLHPVAGQGLNLGLRDAFELAHGLGEAHARGTRLEEALARFRRRRIVDRALTVGATDTLARLFTWPALAPIQSVAFDLLDANPMLRNRFAKALMFGLRSV